MRSPKRNRPKQSQRNQRKSADYDNPWKGMLDRYLPDFLQLFFPSIHALVNWSRPFSSANTDLLKPTRQSAKGGRLADRAFKVTLLSGQPSILLIHIEVQGQRDPTFPARMFTYFYRFFDREHCPVLSMALLTDPHPHWRPDTFHINTGPLHLQLSFPITKLLDFKDRSDELEHSDNPFALIALAHLRHLQLRPSPLDLKAAKLAITKLLLRKNWSHRTLADVFKFLDWILALPDAIDQQFFTELNQLKKTHNMPFLAPFERRAMAQGELIGEKRGKLIGEKRGKLIGEKRGEARGLRDSFTLILQERGFTELPPAVQQRIAKARPTTLRRWIRRALNAQSLAQIFDA